MDKDQTAIQRFDRSAFKTNTFVLLVVSLSGASSLLKQMTIKGRRRVDFEKA
jgi:hypothetical protein